MATTKSENDRRIDYVEFNVADVARSNRFYGAAFRKRLYNTLEQLQSDVDAWLREYNEHRPHSGKYCFGKTPMQTFLDSKHLSDDKQLDGILVETSSDGLFPRAARAVAG